jgi:hypothetical protein
VKPITAEIRVNIPGYGTLRLPLDCAKLEPVQGGVEAWDENQNHSDSWGRTETETDGAPGTSTPPRLDTATRARPRPGIMSASRNRHRN